MAVQPQLETLPYGMGRFSPRWWTAFLLFLAVVGIGAYAYFRQVAQGEIVTGLRDVGAMGGAPWGLYVAFELWAVGIGFGAMMLIGLFALRRMKEMQILTRALGLLALVTLFVGGWSVIADVGQPLRAIVNIMRYARPMSPFFGSVTIGLVTAFASLLAFLYLDSRREAAALAGRTDRWRGFLRLLSGGYRDTEAEQKRHQYAEWGMAVLLIAVAVVAASTSGFIFGIQQGRPGWFSALQAPGFVVLAALTGTAAAIILTATLRAALGERRRLSQGQFQWLGNLMMVLTVTYLYILLVELLTSGYEAHHHSVRVTDAIISGQFAWLFWLTNSLFLVGAVIGIYQAVARRHSVPLMLVAAVCIVLAALGKRYLLVVPSLTLGSLLPYGNGEGSYTPTWVEYMVVVGLIALAAAIYMLLAKLFPVLELSNEDRPSG